MWKLMTEQARRGIYYAKEDARRLGQLEVATENLLAGILTEETAACVRLLKALECDPAAVTVELRARNQHQDCTVSEDDMRLNADGKRSIDLAYDEYKRLRSPMVGTHHLLLGLIRQRKGLAGQILSAHGVDLARARRTATDLYDHDDKVWPPPPTSLPPTP